MFIGFVVLQVLVCFIANECCNAYSYWPPTQCRGVKIIYRGDTCECPKPLPYRIECPESRSVPSITRTYRFRVLRPSVPKDVATDEKTQNHDFECKKPVENQKPW